MIVIYQTRKRSVASGALRVMSVFTTVDCIKTAHECVLIAVVIIWLAGEKRRRVFDSFVVEMMVKMLFCIVLLGLISAMYIDR